MIRFGLAMMAVALLAVGSAHALEVKHVEPRRMEEGDFYRLVNFFGKKADNPTRLVLHANPENKDGYYWVVTLDRKLKKVPEGVQAKLELVLSGSEQAKSYTYDIPTNKSRSNKLYLGVGDKDFADGVFPRILAWKVTLTDKDGNVLDENKSVLWEF